MESIKVKNWENDDESGGGWEWRNVRKKEREMRGDYQILTIRLSFFFFFNLGPQTNTKSEPPTFFFFFGLSE